EYEKSPLANRMWFARGDLQCSLPARVVHPILRNSQRQREPACSLRSSSSVGTGGGSLATVGRELLAILVLAPRRQAGCACSDLACAKRWTHASPRCAPISPTCALYPRCSGPALRDLPLRIGERSGRRLLALLNV